MARGKDIGLLSYTSFVIREFGIRHLYFRCYRSRVEPEWLATLRSQLEVRRDPWVLLEGRASVEAALAGWWEVPGVLIAEDHSWEVPAWSGLEALRRSADELAAMGEPERHGGVLGIAKIPGEIADVARFVKDLAADALLLACPVPGSGRATAAMIRLAEQHGAAGVIFGAEGNSPFEPEAVASSGGSIFRLPIRIADSGQVLRSLKGARFRLIGTGLDQLEDAFDLAAGPGERRAIVCGAETDLSAFWRRACDLLAGDDWQKPLDDD